MKLIDVFTQILKDTTQGGEAVLDVLLRAVVLHTHSLVLAENVRLEDVVALGTPPRTLLAPLTRTHLAQVLATLWPAGDKRRDDAYWIKEYGEQTPFELFTDVPPELAAKAAVSRDVILRHPLVQELIEE